MIYFESDSGALYHDTVLTKNRIQDNSIDLIVASPPYNLSVKYENYKADIPRDEYLEFTHGLELTMGNHIWSLLQNELENLKKIVRQ
jgi:DNA modification methylase